jgi:acyl-CoA synthetase (AMP-forming)/AMP-acid ligase II
VLPSSITGAAQRFGDRAAIVAADKTTITYRELDRRSDALAAGLARRHGVREGTVVALVLPSTATYIAAYLALAKLGAVTGGINPRLAAPEQAAVIDLLAPDVVLDDAGALDALAADGEAPPPLADDPSRVTAVVFTSGTTGQPKGAVFTDSQLESITRMDLGLTGDLDALPWGSGSPLLASTQLPHVGFMTKLPWYLRLGCTLLLQDRWRAADTLRLVAEHRVPSIGGVSAQIGLLLRVPELDTYDLSCVQSLIVGGGPSPPELVREARQRFGAPYSIRYSSTECGGVGTGTAFDAGDDEALHTVGRPRPGVHLRLDPDRGEVLLRSGAVMAGYWRDPELTAATLDADGWLRTGDLGELDVRGCLRLVGRTTDMYIRGGYNVHPQEVEAVLLEHPAVADVAMVPRADPVMGEIGVAVVVVAAGQAVPTVDALRAFAAPRLAAYKLPEAVRVVTELPLTSMDKLDRRALAYVEASRAGGR